MSINYTKIHTAPTISPTGPYALFHDNEPLLPYELCCPICNIGDEEVNCTMCNIAMCTGKSCAMDVSTYNKKQYTCRRCVRSIHNKLKPVYCIELGKLDIRVKLSNE